MIIINFRQLWTYYESKHDRIICDFEAKCVQLKIILIHFNFLNVFKKTFSMQKSKKILKIFKIWKKLKKSPQKYFKK